MARKELSPAALQLVQAVKAAVSNTPQQAAIRIGVSGGADSLALAAAVAHAVARGQIRQRVEALVIDHALFPGSAAHTAVVCDQVRKLGLPVASQRVSVQPRGDGLEAAARTARRAALWAYPTQVGRPITELWLAHTADDQAESVLLALARGSGPRAIAAMSPRRPEMNNEGKLLGEVVRPMLGLRRRISVDACRDWPLTPWHDPANQDPRFTRSAVRQHGLPALTAVLGEGLVPGLVRTASLAQQDGALLDDLARQAARTVRVGEDLDCAALAAQPLALRGRIVHAWLSDRGAQQVSFGAIESVLALVDSWHGQGVLHLAGVQVLRRSGLLIAQPRTPAL